MKSIHILFIIQFFIILNPTYAQEWKQVIREPISILKNERSLNKELKSALKNPLIQELNNQGIITELTKGKYTAQQFIDLSLKSSSFTRELDQCLLIHEDSLICQKFILNDLILHLRALKKIDDLASLILKAHIDQNKQQLNWLKFKRLDLPSYAATLNQMERNYLKNQASIQSATLSQRSFRQKNSVWGKITPRQELYLNYNFIEIKFMAQILLKAQERILAHSAFISWDFDGDGVIDDQFKTPESWKYDMALNILDLTLQQETLSQGILANQQISKQHLLMAASELGLINELMIQEMLNLPDFKKIKAPKAEMYLRALWSVGKTAIALVPGGIYFILPIIIIETVVENNIKKKQDKPRVF